MGNFKKAIAHASNRKTDLLSLGEYDDSHIYFIPSATMVQRDEVIKAKKDGKKIILRIDNAVRNSRNRNTGMSRMQDFAKMADLVVYQSEWSRSYLSPFTGVDGPVIHNSVDETIFNPTERNTNKSTYLYSRFNRDETKNWEMARYWFQKIQRADPEARLYIVGQFSDNLRNGNFDFFMGENYDYIGVIDSPVTMANLYKRCDYLIYPYFNDACSNTLIEAMMCGCEVYEELVMATTGGAPELIVAFQENGAKYFHLERMLNSYEGAIKDELL